MNEKNELSELPKGWVKVKIGDLAHFINGKTFHSSDWRTKGIPIIRIQNLNNKNSPFNYIDQKNDIPEKYHVKNGDLLFAWSGTPGTSFGAHIWKGSDAYLNQHIFKVIPFNGVHKKFLFYNLNQLVNQFVKQSRGTAGLSHITKKELETTECFLPSTDVQIKIADKIDELFSELENSIESLEKVKRKLEIYKFTLLNDAFTGKLTIEWRKNNVSFSALSELKLLKIKRVEINNSAENDITKNLSSDFHFQQHNTISTWAIAKLDKLVTIHARVGWKGLKKDEYTESGPLFLSVHSLNYGKHVDFKEVNHISKNRYDESPEIKLQNDDILLCKDGAGIGKVGIVKKLPTQATINSSLLIIRGHEAFLSDYLYYLFLGPKLQRIVTDRVSGSAIPHLFQRDIKEFMLEVPPIEEQNQIVNEIERRLTLVEHLEKNTISNLQKVEVLKNSILKKAFIGELVRSETSTMSIDEFLIELKRDKEKHLIKEKQESRNRKPKTMENNLNIEKILQQYKDPISAKDVWQQSIHRNDIEEFYKELKRLGSKVKEIRNETESLLTLAK
jgi:type I restriction enzyme, S subunit